MFCVNEKQGEMKGRLTAVGSEYVQQRLRVLTALQVESDSNVSFSRTVQQHSKKKSIGHQHTNTKGLETRFYRLTFPFRILKE